MSYYPVFLELHGRRCLVVGGGTVGLGKVRGLLAAGGRVTVVSPRFEPALNAFAESGQISAVRRLYTETDLDSSDFVFVATDDREANARIAADCRRRNLLVNVADDPEHCDFILPSVVRKGTITLAASTAGASPALARKLREDLEAYLDDDMPLLAELLGEVRRDLQARGCTVSSDAWHRAIDSRLRALLAQGRYDEARERLLASLGVEARDQPQSKPDSESLAE